MEIVFLKRFTVTSRVVKYVDIFPSSTEYAGSSYESLGRISSAVRFPISSFSSEMDFLKRREVFRLNVGKAKDSGTVIRRPNVRKLKKICNLINLLVTHYIIEHEQARKKLKIYQCPRETGC